MSNVTKRTVVTRTDEYAIPIPGTWDDLLKAIAWVERDLGPKRSQWGDAVTVRATDDELILAVAEESERAS